jgi:hypothetical protein
MSLTRVSRPCVPPVTRQDTTAVALSGTFVSETEGPWS